MATRRTRRARGGRDLNEEILEAARVVFFRYGLRRVTMDDIAREAHVSRQTLYTRFGNKEALFVTAAEHMFAEAQEHVEQALAAEGDVWTRIQAAFEASNVPHLREFENSDHSAELMATAATLLQASMEAKEKKIMDVIAAELTAARKRGEIRLEKAITPRVVAEMLVRADYGFKQDVATVQKYRARLRTMIHLMRLATRP